jgi:hypothetical protein
MSDNALMIINVLQLVVIVAMAFYLHLIQPGRPASRLVLIVDVLLIIVLVASSFHTWVKNFG